MRSRLAFAIPLLGACALVAVSASALRASEKQNPRADAAVAAPSAASGDAASTPPATPAASDAGTAADLDAAANPFTPNTFNLSLMQRGSGAMVHYPVPEQLQQTEVPVFVQVRTTAPLDHVSLFYRGHGGTRYREIRMTSVGSSFGLPGGWGAQIPCDDAFPPSVEYHVQAVATSGDSIGSAGSATAPIELPVVLERTNSIVPTLPGEQPPRNCGTIQVRNPTAARDGGVRHDGGAVVEDTSGTADLGEPCRKNDDCRRGLRCGTNRQCVFNR